MLPSTPPRRRRALPLLLAVPLLAAFSQPPTPAPDSPAETPAKATWDVQSPPGSWRDVPIDTDEGTWLSLDVSPDGAEIVFDFLGDLYIMPITGGEPRPLTRGIAWDMHPRFSPDGAEIAFTSDRGGDGVPGGDNIWVVSRDGSATRPITKESFRLVTSPVWTPDGEFIAARKHFTSGRSLGAGEIWLYHASGGAEGLQMTTRPTEQKDVGEPAFSLGDEAGRYLYYSLDVTPGPTFEYSKDPNPGIYAIDRLDRTTGRTERYIAGPGGAVRPTPSPDGESLAFVRRVRDKTVLFVQDLRSGLALPVYDDLERDMQETWAIHGVYPTFAWTPDSESVVLWARGKIRRVDVATGDSEVIPFHIKDTRRVADTLRFPVEVAPETFDVKMLRSVQVSPRGDLVAYQALGHIYVRPLPDGEPRRLISQTDHFEFFPSFSRDGGSIVYATWNDDDLGSIRVVPVGGGEGRTLTAEPGHYVDPVFTPDGEQVLYGKVSGGYLTSPLWSADTGVYRVPTSGDAEPKLVTRTGTDPQFGADSGRVYLMTVEHQKDSARRSLISVTLDGADPRTHFVSENATEYAVSADGRWVAWSERFHVFVAPFVATGREVSIGPKTASFPVAKVSRDSGWHLHFSGDSSRLHWSLGPDLYTCPVAASDTGPAASADATTSQNISFTAPQDAPAGTIALTGARIITMTGEGGDDIIEDGTVVVESNRITAIGPRSSTPIPTGATVFEFAGHTIIPGIIDAHAHGAMAVNGITPQHNWQQLANLAFGVTTCHDPSNDTRSVFAAAELAKAGLVTLPRTFSTGTILYGAAGTARAEIDSLDDARFHLRRMKASGAVSVKSYNQPRRDQRQQVIEAARELGMLVVPEGGSLFQHNMTMVVDGHTGVEHSLPVETAYDDVVQLWSATQSGYTPTLVVAFGGSAGENYWYDRTEVWADERLLRYVPRATIDPRSRRRTAAPDEEYNHLRSAAITKALIDAGTTVQLGAHGQLPGLGAHWEMWMFVQGGMTPHEALRSATLHGARHLGMDADLGSIEPGKLADLVILERNPLEDIRNTHSVAMTMLNGRLYNAATMAQLAPAQVDPPTLFFHHLQSGRGVVPPSIGGCAGCTLPGGGCGLAPWHEEPDVSGYR